MSYALRRIAKLERELANSMAARMVLRDALEEVAEYFSKSTSSTLPDYLEHIIDTSLYESGERNE